MSLTTLALRLPQLCLGVVAAAIVAMTVSTAAPVQACGFCNTPSGLRILHPKPLDVAVAIRRELDSGLLKKGAAVSVDKAQRHFRDLQTGRILAERLALRAGFELLLIEDGSHYRIDGQRGRGHAERPAPPPVRWVTGRDVLLALLERQLNFETAVKQGLIVIEKTSAGADR